MKDVHQPGRYSNVFSPYLEPIARVEPGVHTVRLPVWTPGALFFTGDCHAGQGQGELRGMALEIPAEVVLRFDEIKSQSIIWPRIKMP